MVDVIQFWISEDHLVQVKTNLNKRKHSIVVDEGKPKGFWYEVSLVKGKGILDFLERLYKSRDSNSFIDACLKDSIVTNVPVSKKGRKRKLKGKLCNICNSSMTKLYLHNNVNDSRKWVPVAWYCVSCDKIRDRIHV